MKYLRVLFFAFLTFRFLVQPEIGNIGSFITVDIQQEKPSTITTSGLKVFTIEL